MAIASEPVNVSQVERNQKLFSLLWSNGCRARIQAHVDFPQGFVISDFAIAVDIQMNESKVNRQLDVGRSDFSQRCFGLSKIVNEVLQNLSKLLILQRVRGGIG